MNVVCFYRNTTQFQSKRMKFFFLQLTVCSMTRHGCDDFTLWWFISDKTGKLNYNFLKSSTRFDTHFTAINVAQLWINKRLSLADTVVSHTTIHFNDVFIVHLIIIKLTIKLQAVNIKLLGKTKKQMKMTMAIVKFNYRFVGRSFCQYNAYNPIIIFMCNLFLIFN